MAMPLVPNLFAATRRGNAQVGFILKKETIVCIPKSNSFLGILIHYFDSQHKSMSFPCDTRFLMAKPPLSQDTVNAPKIAPASCPPGATSLPQWSKSPPGCGSFMDPSKRLVSFECFSIEVFGKGDNHNDG